MEGAVAKPSDFSIDDIMKLAPLEERIYRHRCVEAWSIVVPWIGFPLSALLKQVEPTSKAKFVAFQSFYDPNRCRWASAPAFELPYVEGLRMDEAMHPLALLCVGMYGEALPNQNGAPVRLVVPWKYGFKSIKSIVKIRFVEKQPPTTWNIANAHEYGFYSNVNPAVDHPRWSQAKERRLGEFFKRDDADVQRLRRPGGQPLRRHGPAEVLLDDAAKRLVLSSSTRSCSLLCLAPVACCWPGAHSTTDLSANPIEFITHFTGDWTLRFLVITLAITPLRKLFQLA